ncbi:MAG: amidohydrolase family protein [Methanothrix sp.]
MSGSLQLKSTLLYAFAVAAILVAGCFVCYNATLYTAGAAQEGYLALTNATVLEGEDLEPINRAAVLIKDGTIIEVGEEGDIDIPPEAKVLDLTGYTLMPGLIDMHVHLGPQTYKANEEPDLLTMPKLVFDWVRFYPDTRRAFLENGVTTVRDLGNEYGWIMVLRRQLRDGALEGPRLFAAGPIFTTPGGHPVATFGVDPASDSVRLPSTPEEARLVVRELADGDDRVDLIKVVQERGRPRRGLEPIAPEVLDAIVTEAHDQGLPVTAHWGSLEDLEDVIAAGVDGLEHVEARAVLDGWPDGVLDMLVERNIPITPTRAVTDAALPSQISSQLRLRVGELYAAGGWIVVGSDAPINGVPFGAGVHRELQLLVESGLAPQEALRTATSEAARALRTGSIGAIEPGCAADLLAVDGDPLQDIKDAQNVVMVFRDGRRVVNRQSTG